MYQNKIKQKGKHDNHACLYIVGTQGGNRTHTSEETGF